MEPEAALRLGLEGPRAGPIGPEASGPGARGEARGGSD